LLYGSRYLFGYFLLDPLVDQVGNLRLAHGRQLRLMHFFEIAKQVLP